MLWWFCSLSNLHLQVLTERRFFAASTSECSIAELSRCRGRADLLHQQTDALCQCRATSAICVKALLTAAVAYPWDIENPGRARDHLDCLYRHSRRRAPCAEHDHPSQTNERWTLLVEATAGTRPWSQCGKR
jgi:hypothetical protein